MSASVLFDAPGPKARTRHLILTVIGALLALAGLWVVIGKMRQAGQLEPALWEPFVTDKSVWVDYLLVGLWNTIKAALLSVVFAGLFGLLLGMVLAVAGVLVSGWTQSAWILVVGILFFSLGEMTTGPKKSEYLALIAPPGKKGLYLGYVNIPVGVGVYFGSTIAGYVYGQYGEKAVLALRYIAEHTPLGQAKAWNGEVASLEATLGLQRSGAMARLQDAGHQLVAAGGERHDVRHRRGGHRDEHSWQKSVHRRRLWRARSGN